jgi:hypothetical protein
MLQSFCSELVHYYASKPQRVFNYAALSGWQRFDFSNKNVLPPQDEC